GPRSGRTPCRATDQWSRAVQDTSVRRHLRASRSGGRSRPPTQMIGPRRGPVIANIELLLYLNYGSSATIIARVHPFPAEIPAAEARRADVVEVRVARKVAPLFGLASDIEPFRRSWVRDFTALTLAEIGRGAPSPDRSERSQLDNATAGPDATAGLEAQPSDGWRWSGRAVWSPRGGHLP